VKTRFAWAVDGRTFLRALAAAVAPFALSACSCINIPKQCCKPTAPVADKKTLLYGERAAFQTVWMEGGGRRWKVFVIGEASRPPVLLLHEIPALSPGALKLAERLSEKFRVYVPLLFGGELDNNNNELLRAWRPIEIAFLRPSWNALGSGERKITRDLSGLCRTIVSEHGSNARLAVIGMCITGNIPLQLVGQKNPLPELKGLVLAQPTIPILTCNAAQKKSLGISDQELERAKIHVKGADLRILGFRFERDAVSPAERFTRLKDEFGPRFIDWTLLARDYVDADGMPKEAHAVLTDGFCKARKGPPHASAGEKAYAKLRNYLEETLIPKG
jgi:dienelactone hydrolase